MSLLAARSPHGAGNTADGRNVLVMGGANLFGQYLDAGVIDEFTVTIAPVLLGSGKRLFGAVLRPASHSSRQASSSRPLPHTCATGWPMSGGISLPQRLGPAKQALTGAAVLARGR
jgi:RibD C-terminal domain